MSQALDGEQSVATDGAPAPAASWRPVERSRAYELVIDRIEEQIREGALRVGDRLPGERDLASMLGVSRSAVREATRALEAQGVVRVGVGVGRDGGTFLTSLSSAALTQLLRLHIALANFPVSDVIEARILFERSSALLAAEHATDADLEEIQSYMSRMEHARGDIDVFNDLDTAFHVAIAEAGRNRLVADMTVAIRESMRGLVHRSFTRHQDWPALADILCMQHRRVADALAVRNGAEAADGVEAHIRYAYTSLGWDQEQ